MCGGCDKCKACSEKFAKGGVVGDVFSLKNKKQSQQIITVYNELHKNFFVDNYVLDHTNNSVVFIIKTENYSTYLKTKIQNYIDSLKSKGFDVFDDVFDFTKNKSIDFQKDKSKGFDCVYFKVKLLYKIEYLKGGNVSNEFNYPIGGL